MANLEFGIWDSFGDVEHYPSAAEAYEHHIRDAVEAESLGFKSYFFIEHQNAPFAYISAPNVYLAALARETSSLRFGPMVYQLPMHHPIRLAQDAAMVDNLSQGRLEFGAGYGIHAHEFTRWELIDLSGFRVRLKAEFEGSNADMYREAAVVAGSAK